ncbi:hypothetical protein CY34DRAFT_800141 [Suillus luteus UH-Slu-Lm8-n1]|uniref:Uncharacterized protein n=1 Tax=Suillus luteus UH-Slu-Lm8-n1 TaxID=930992 RepID=A0A0D0BA82_9AGAM|nr:hypothetical protein CY34DRAFT_800141 [Suillus luteus UH-Slu-Lm8-n1]
MNIIKVRHTFYLSLLNGVIEIGSRSLLDEHPRLLVNKLPQCSLPPIFTYLPLTTSPPNFVRDCLVALKRVVAWGG